ncbi:hypothetical protein ILYODFUR_010177 [Ilyodon furcidens]|uniref:Uncharacterized protein n=1 Tax=Ilyodon furcidens TaxID=33524 RepID=A0ABV0V2P1_9TELE
MTLPPLSLAVAKMFLDLIASPSLCLTSLFFSPNIIFASSPLTIKLFFSMASQSSLKKKIMGQGLLSWCFPLSPWKCKTHFAVDSDTGIPASSFSVLGHNWELQEMLRKKADYH